jgi:hypothetical protein
MRMRVATSMIAGVLLLSPAAHAGEAGLRAYVDPSTGRNAAPPAASALDPRSQSLPTPAAASQPTPVAHPAPGGGDMLDVRGRLQSDVVATVQPDGNVTVRCLQNGAPTH